MDLYTDSKHSRGMNPKPGLSGSGYGALPLAPIPFSPTPVWGSARDLDPLNERRGVVVVVVVVVVVRRRTPLVVLSSSCVARCAVHTNALSSVIPSKCITTCRTHIDLKIQVCPPLWSMLSHSRSLGFNLSNPQDKARPNIVPIRKLNTCAKRSTTTMKPKSTNKC